MIITAVVAADSHDVIGRGGALPWYLPGDLRRFKKLTLGHVVVTGRVTYESILARLGRPLPGRTTVVASRTLAGTGLAEVRLAHSLTGAMELAEALAAGAGQDELFVIGGESVFRQVMPAVTRVCLTRVHAAVDGDRVMPPGWLDGFELVRAEPADDPRAELAYSYLDYERPAR